MKDERRPSLSFRITPGSSGPQVDLRLHVPDGNTGPADAKSDLLPLAAVLAWYTIQAIRHENDSLIEVDQMPFGIHGELFNKAWHFLKNSLRQVSLVRAGEYLQHLKDWLKPCQDKNRKPSRFIRIDARRLVPGNVWFGVVNRTGISSDCDTEAKLLALFQYLIGAVDSSVLTTVPEGRDSVSVFRFGTRPTGTYVLRAFPGGLTLGQIRCRLTGEPYAVPPEFELLIDRAHAVLRRDAAGVLAVKDQAMLAPRRVAIELPELDSGELTLEFALSDSNYRYYIAFAFARKLARFDPEFGPLADFVQSTIDPHQPSPATCSMGVRVLMETADRQLIVAFRSRQVKMNPNIWSVSANEGVRRNLLESGGEVSDLLRLAYNRALLNELKVQAEECHEPLLLSIYRNEFHQWGAGFCVKTLLTADQVIGRQPMAGHGFEHARMARLPIDLDACGRAMRDLGSRWYGGALETICQYFSWRELTQQRYLSAEEVGSKLSHAANHALEPVDEVNPALLPAQWVG